VFYKKITGDAGGDAGGDVRELVASIV